MPIDRLIKAGMKAYKETQKPEPMVPSLSNIRPETARTAKVKAPMATAPVAPARSTKGKGDPNLLADKMGGMAGAAVKGLRGRSKY